MSYSLKIKLKINIIAIVFILNNSTFKYDIEYNLYFNFEYC